MSNRFTKIAEKATSLSPLMNGREKIDIDEIISYYPYGITITEFDIITTGVDTFPVFLFEEDNTKFGFGGIVLHQIIDSWVQEFEGDIEATSKALKADGGVKMKFKKSRTKTGNNVTLIEILD